ncbi:MAG: hypothetical protein KIT31_14330 [Deltaproteobacteria bacterium]|nr:hypothetical protein [Deltaproteobacteria bacterium]
MTDCRTTSSLFDNLARVLAQRAPRSAHAMMGARWSFAWPVDAPSEFSIPADYVAAVARRSGLRVVQHAGAESIDGHLDAGESVVLAVDAFHLEHRPAFGRVHAARTVLVRAGRNAREVWLDDWWQPAYLGPIDRTALERARRSQVPYDPRLEPVYSGTPIDGEWFSMAIDSIQLADVSAWAAAILCELIVGGKQGLVALRALYNDVCGTPTPTLARSASLVLRAELSTRVFLCAWLRAAARWLEAPTLLEVAARYYDALEAMETSRDLLAKCVAHPRPAYQSILLARLGVAIAVEEQLASSLEPISERNTPCGSI